MDPFRPARRAGLPLDGEWFAARVTAVTSGSPNTYRFREVWVLPDGSVAEVAGGRVNTAPDPAVSLGGVLAAGDVALCRPAAGAGNLKWELFAGGAGSGGGQAPGGCAGGCGGFAQNLTRATRLKLTVAAASGACAPCVPAEPGTATTPPTPQSAYLVYDAAAKVWAEEGDTPAGVLVCDPTPGVP